MPARSAGGTSRDTTRAFRNATPVTPRRDVFGLGGGAAMDPASFLFYSPGAGSASWSVSQFHRSSNVWVGSLAESRAGTFNFSWRLAAERVVPALSQYPAPGDSTWTCGARHRPFRSRPHQSPHARWAGISALSRMSAASPLIQKIVVVRVYASHLTVSVAVVVCV